MEPQANEIRSEHRKRTATNQIALASRRTRASKKNIAGQYCPARDELNGTETLEPQGLHDSLTSRGYVSRFPISVGMTVA
jgi:hypothetical protein